MNRMSFYYKVLSLIILSCLSISAYAWYNPTRKYSAKVQAGLSTSSTGGGLVYVDNEGTDFITVSDGDWRPNSQYDGCEGGNSSNTQNDMVDVYLYAKATPGYQFDGWATSNSGTPANKGDLVNGVYRSVKEFQVGDNSWAPIVGYYNRNKSYTMYAFFTPIEYKITYDANGGTVSPSTTHPYTIRSTDALRTPTRTGYTFNGWKVTQVNPDEGNWTMNTTAASPLSNKFGDVTLTAQWTPTQYTISFSPNGGTGTTPSSIPYSIESAAITLPACPYTKTGSVFAGWKPSSNVGSWTTGQTFADQASIPTGQYGNVTLVAQWEQNADITISVTGLQNGESAIFTVSKGGTVLYTVSLDSSNTSVTIKNQEIGEYTVTPVTGWSFAYTMSAAQTKTISATDHTFSFTASPKSGVKKHDEQQKVNWK